MTDPAQPETHAAELTPEEFQPAAALLALALPGAGHAYLGQTRRGVLIGAGVLGLFFGGLLIGGIGVVDSGLVVTNRVKALYARITGSKVSFDRTDGEPIWFFGQAFVGPVAFITDHLHQYSFKVRDPAQPDYLRPAFPGETRNPATGLAEPAQAGQRPPSTRSLGRVNELGTLFCTVAGMMNLICVIDAGFSRRKRKPGTF
ncbi:MAG: hypothetical protein KIT68_12315 [Phycisphaeraceae bacterium]|nr:hypothetical protein [Phycisphaeraceae bacterium]